MQVFQQRWPVLRPFSLHEFHYNPCNAVLDVQLFVKYSTRALQTKQSYIKTNNKKREREREMFYLTTHSTHFIYGYMASDIWLRTILIVRKETRCCHIGYSYRLTARVLLYAPSHRQDNTYHGLCYTSRGALAGTRNSSMGPPHEGSITRPIAPWANALPLSYVLLPIIKRIIIKLMSSLYGTKLVTNQFILNNNNNNFKI